MSSAPPSRPAGSGYGRYAGALAIVLLILVSINTLLTKPNGASGIAPGQLLAPFAVPLASGTLVGDANVATGPGQGGAGRVPACSVRGPQILNICQLYERSPVVLALFVDAGSCQSILAELQALVRSFPGVRFAAVAIKGQRAALRRLIASKSITFPVGIDSDGALAALYKLANCPQVSFAYPGGIVQSKAMLSAPGPATLRARVAELLSASMARARHTSAG